MRLNNLLPLALMLCITAAAEAKCLVLTLSSGSKVYYQLGGETNPVMHFVDDHVTIDTRTFSFQSIQSFQITEEDAPDGIAELVQERKLSFTDNTLIIKGNATASVRILDLSGRDVRAEITRSADCISISLSQFPSSTYIIRVGNETFKIHKK